MGSQVHMVFRAQSRCVIVAGSPRSGTSWLAKGLSYAPGFTYYREPDNFHHVREAEARFAWLYLTDVQDDPAYSRLMTRACAGKIATAFTMKENPGPLLAPLGKRGLRLGQRFPALFLRRRNVLLKLVYANLNLDWLTYRFPTARQVLVFRHPCGQFESWRRMGWQPEPIRCLDNTRLMEEHLDPFAHLLSRASTYWERAGALWAAIVYVAHRQTVAAGGRLIVAYEWLCGDPLGRFNDLYRQLDLTWNPRAERFLSGANRSGNDAAYSLSRLSEKEIDKWKQRLSDDEIAQCRRFVEPFGLPYYPRFEPRVTSFSGDRVDP